MNGKILGSCLAALMLCTSQSQACQVNFAPGTPIVEAVRALGLKAEKNIIVNGDIKGTLSLFMEDATFEEALNSIALASNISYEYLGENVIVAPSRDLVSFTTIKLKHLEPEKVKEQFEPLLNRVIPNPEEHTVTLVGPTPALHRVQTKLAQLDQERQQVNIKASVIEISKGKARKIGLSYGSEPWSKDTSVSGYNGFKFSVVGSHEESLAHGNVLAKPDITTFDGKEAKILMGDRVPVFTSTTSGFNVSDTSINVEYHEVGVKLEVIPRINDDDKETITMVIKPSVSTISQWVESGNNKAPQISERSAETTIRVKSGQTIILGGLLKEEEIKNIKQIPFLSKLPILGELFKSRSTDKRNSEVIIAITPTIVKDAEGNAQVTFTQPEINAENKQLQAELAQLQQENNALRQEVVASNSLMSQAIKELEEEDEQS